MLKDFQFIFQKCTLSDSLGNLGFLESFVSSFDKSKEQKKTPVTQSSFNKKKILLNLYTWTAIVSAVRNPHPNHQPDVANSWMVLSNVQSPPTGHDTLLHVYQMHAESVSYRNPLNNFEETTANPKKLRLRSFSMANHVLLVGLLLGVGLALARQRPANHQQPAAAQAPAASECR